MSEFKVLLLFPNGEMMNPPPISIGIFTSLLKENGFKVDLFDTTLYPDPDNLGSDTAKEENLMVRPFDYGERGVTLKTSRIEDDLAKKVETFKPDLVAISILECTYPTAISMLNVMEDFNIPIIAGGVFPTFSPEVLFSKKNVRMVCIGEGEHVLLEVCQRMAAGDDCSNIENLWVKKDGRIIKNKLRKLVDINSIPIPDYSLFEPERFYRPMAGKIYQTIPIETNRGCLYSCTFCNSPSMAKLYKHDGAGTYFRKKRMNRIQQELQYLVKKWDAEYVYFTSDTFLAVNDSEFDEFCEIYKDYGLPFWLQSRPETITEHRAKRLKEIGCHRMSIGLEHGNSEFRTRVLKKKFKNEQMIKVSRILADAGIPLTVNNIIGFPEETRELIFDTIELNRKLVFDTANAIPFAPFHGTPLQKICVEKGYVREDFHPGSLNVDVSLDMPQLSREEIKGLKRTFSLYARMPKKYWAQIERAEKFDKDGNRIFSELKKIYQEKYFGL